jgi:hypothetical protein
MAKVHEQGEAKFTKKYCDCLFVSWVAPRNSLFLWDGDISWTMTSRGHFLSKWATSREHCQRVTSRGHFLVTSRGHF